VSAECRQPVPTVLSVFSPTLTTHSVSRLILSPASTDRPVSVHCDTPQYPALPQRHTSAAAYRTVNRLHLMCSTTPPHSTPPHSTPRPPSHRNDSSHFAIKSRPIPPKVCCCKNSNHLLYTAKTAVLLRRTSRCSWGFPQARQARIRRNKCKDKRK